MALQNNFIPNTSLVFTPRDYAQQIAQNQADDTRAVQNAFKFGTQFADWNTNSKIANELRKENPDLKEIDALAASRINTPDTGASMWRWKSELDRAKTEKETQAAKALQNLKYKIDAQLGTIGVNLNTTPEQQQQFINTLADLEEQGLSGEVGKEYMKKIWDKQAELRGDLPYNAKMAALDELKDIDANYGKGSDYDKLNDQQKFEVFTKKLNAARDELKKNNPILWQMLEKDRAYDAMITNLLTGRRPKAKGKTGPRAVK